MTNRSVTTQAELDAALADPNVTWVDIHSPAGVWLDLSAYDSATVRAYGSATVRAYGSATVSAYGSATVRASGSATVSAYDSATVSASGSATVRAYGSATVRAYGSATVRAYGSATVRASDSATVRASGSATVSAYDSATVSAYGSATVRASDSATVSASDSATVRAYDSATVSASDSATVRAYDSATVSASSRTAVHLHSGDAHVSGGVLIDHTDEGDVTAELWCDIHGVIVTDGWATVYKAVRADLRSGHDFSYPIGETVTCDDWVDNDECGNGLHFSPSPFQALAYDSHASRFLECQVELAQLRPLVGRPAKCKAPKARVVAEVDEWLRPVGVELVAGQR